LWSSARDVRNVRDLLLCPPDAAHRFQTTAADCRRGSRAAQRERPNDPTLDRGEKIPYLKLPGGGYRIPQAQLLASLSGTYDLRQELADLDERFAEMTEEQVHAALAAADKK
jgi:hypothetical protein